jgi:hypothetical protein
LLKAIRSTSLFMDPLLEPPPSPVNFARVLLLHLLLTRWNIAFGIRTCRTNRRKLRLRFWSRRNCFSSVGVAAVTNPEPSRFRSGRYGLCLCFATISLNVDFTGPPNNSSPSPSSWLQYSNTAGGQAANQRLCPPVLRESTPGAFRAINNAWSCGPRHMRVEVHS